MVYRVMLYFTCINILLGCSRGLELSNIPEIELISLRFEANTIGTTRDSLYVEILFRDGNGDLGLKASDINPPFHALDTLNNSNGKYIFFNPLNDVYNYDNWLIVNDLPTSKRNPIKVNNNTAGLVVDTVKVVKNFERHYNFFVVPYYMNDNGTFEKVKNTTVDGIQAAYTDQFFSRFPVLNTESNPRPLEGVLKGRFSGIYSENPILSQRVLKFEIYIKDKALNESNHVFTEPLQLVIR